jgi:hypothetical protein
MKDIIGKYRGIKVYRVTLPEYVNGRSYKDEENMYLIDGELIYKNEIFAKYDGRYVEEYDAYKRATYYTMPVVEAKVTTNGKGVTHVEYETNLSVPVGNSKNESKTSTEKLDVEAIIVGVYDTDYFSGMTDIDAFLKSNS